MADSTFRVSPLGQRVDIGGYQLHAHVSGSGTPTMVFEPGLGGFALQWMQIYPQVAQFARTVIYDRAGQGWSDPSPHPRTPAQMTAELHTLLERLDIQPPYIIAGHSLGGLLARAFADRYRADVAGVALVDSAHEMQYTLIPNFDKLRGQTLLALKLITLASRLGLGGWLAGRSLSAVRPYIPADQWRTVLYLAGRVQHHQTVAAEFDEWARFFGETSEIPKTLGDLPLMVITAGDSLSGQRAIGKITAEQQNAAHQARQRELVALSSHGQQQVIAGATHLSILLHPQYAAQVVEAIRQLVMQARG